MKEDILEQLVDDYLQAEGYFTRHNIKFRPSKECGDFDVQKDSNPSDIDVLAIHPRKRGADRVIAVSCKSWQAGFDVRVKLEEITQNKKRSGRESWKMFRELVSPKWADAFCETIREITGSERFTYVTAVTKLKGDRSLWEQHRPFVENVRGNPIQLLALDEMVEKLIAEMTKTVASSQFGRTLQLLKTAGLIHSEHHG